MQAPSLNSVPTNMSSDGDDANGISRASSVSAKDKSTIGKRKTNKQRRDDAESFDSRSNYVAWCGPQQGTWAPAGPHYYPVNSSPYNGQFQQPYPTGMQPVFGPNQPYPQMMPNNGYAPQFNVNGMTPVSSSILKSRDHNVLTEASVSYAARTAGRTSPTAALPAT